MNPGDVPLQNIIAIREWKANERKSRIAPLKRSSSRSGVIFAGNIENDVSDKCETSDETRKVSSEPDLHKASPDMPNKRRDEISCEKEDFSCNDIKVDFSQSCGIFSIEGYGNPQSSLSQNNHPNKTSTKSKEEIVLDLSSLFEAYSTTILKPTFGHLRDKSSNHSRTQRDTPNESSGRAQITSKHTPNMLPNMDQKRPFCNAIEISKPQKGLYEPSQPTFPGRTLTSLKSNNIQINHGSCTATNSEKLNRTRQNFILDPKSGIYLGLMKENYQSQNILHTPLDSNLPGMVDDIIKTENRDIGERDVRATHIGVLKTTNYEFFDSRNQYDLKEIMMVFDKPLDYGVNSIKDPIRSCSHISSLHLGDYGNHKTNSA